MIRVSKIAHAAYETPDLAQQTEYYADIIGLTLAAQEKDGVYLASTVDHHSIVRSKSRSPAMASPPSAAKIPSRRSRTCWFLPTPKAR